MTRVSSYTLYQCPSCEQIHIKNEYGSISIYVPTDLHLEPTENRACKRCGKVNQVKDYICLGLRSKTVTIEKTYKNNFIGRLYKSIHQYFSPPKDVDLSNLYPYI